MENEAQKVSTRQVIGLTTLLVQIICFLILWNTPGIRLVDFSSGLATDILFSHILIVWLAFSLLSKARMAFNLESKFSLTAVLLFVFMLIIAGIIPEGPSVHVSHFQYLAAYIFLLGSFVVDILELLRSLIFKN